MHPSKASNRWKRHYFHSPKQGVGSPLWGACNKSCDSEGKLSVLSFQKVTDSWASLTSNIFGFHACVESHCYHKSIRGRVHLHCIIQCSQWRCMSEQAFYLWFYRTRGCSSSSRNRLFGQNLFLCNVRRQVAAWCRQSQTSSMGFNRISVGTAVLQRSEIFHFTAVPTAKKIKGGNFFRRSLLSEEVLLISRQK